jgi:glucose 1-dehydrogenase
MKKLFSLKKRTALVTGSTRGIGRAILLGLAEAGANVISHGINAGDNSHSVLAEAAAFGVEARFLPGDLSLPGAGRELARRVLSEAGTVDIVILNASLQFRRPWTEITSQEATQQWQTNFQSSLEIMQVLVPGMCERGWGRVLAIGSVQQVKPHPEMAVYAATKMAQLSLVRNLARQVGRNGVTVNNLSPGVILTDRNKAPLADPEYAEAVMAKIPSNRFGLPEDCVGVALLLCSEDGSYITGQDFSVDGGMSL